MHITKTTSYLLIRFTRQPDYWVNMYSGTLICRMSTMTLNCNKIFNRSHAAFYPNRGLAPQPGCEGSDLFSFTACSHYIASQFYAESILFPTAFQAHQCDTSVIKSPTAHYNCINESNVVWMGEYIDRKYVVILFNSIIVVRCR